MKMIIGGAFQGKKKFAQDNYPLTKWIDGMHCSGEEILTAQGVIHFHEYIRRILKDGEDPIIFAGKLMQENPNLILVTNELGYGVVPIDAFDRAYREATGRVCSVLAQHSDEVYRVVCGIGQRIK